MVAGVVAGRAFGAVAHLGHPFIELALAEVPAPHVAQVHHLVAVRQPRPVAANDVGRRIGGVRAARSGGERSQVTGQVLGTGQRAQRHRAEQRGDRRVGTRPGVVETTVPSTTRLFSDMS